MRKKEKKRKLTYFYSKLNLQYPIDNITKWRLHNKLEILASYQSIHTQKKRASKSTAITKATPIGKKREGRKEEGKREHIRGNQSSVGRRSVPAGDPSL